MLLPFGKINQNFDIDGINGKMILEQSLKVSEAIHHEAVKKFNGEPSLFDNIYFEEEIAKKYKIEENEEEN
mgnify:CR=1 FL=1